MMNVVLIDIQANYLQSLLKIDDINIKMLVVEKCLLEQCKQKYSNIENFYYRFPETNQEFQFLNKSSYNLTYTDIEKYRSTQLKCEHYLHREILDDGVMQFRYYLALNFWLGFFETNKIDAVIDCHLEHGALWDSIPIDIAKNTKIPVYNIADSTASNEFAIKHIVRLNDKNFLDISELKLTQCKFDIFFESIKKTYHYFALNQQPKFNFLKTATTAIKYIKSYIKCYRKSFTDSYKKYIKSRDIFQWQFITSYEDEYKQFNYIKQLKNVYQKISNKPNYNEKFIYYPLHQDPEATIMGRTPMSSQLFIIKSIQSILPPNWKLYVKEHPSQFSIYYQDGFSYYLKNIQYFRSTYFYNHIESLPNVKLIDVNANGKELLLKSQCVCSICGTSLLEGIIMKKPVLVYGEATTFIELVKDCFVINSTTALKKAIRKIQNGFMPQYGDLETIYKKYTFSQKQYGDTLMSYNNELVNLFKFILQDAKDKNEKFK